LCFAAGCRERPTPAPAPTGDSRSTYADRLAAAIGIVDLNTRDDALVAVAKSAASAGEADVVKQALAKTADLNKRDAAAEACALALAKAGKRAEASDVARRIVDLSRRDKTLARLATE
jgi:hypothetical protein